MSRPLLRVIATAALSLGLLGCSSAGGSTESSSTAPGTTKPGSAMPSGSGEMTEVGALGEPADAAMADRTVHVTASDQLKFAPDALQVKVGETVTFEIENAGTTDHEFVIGSPEYQAAHEQEMQAGHMEMGDEPNAVDVPAGDTKSLTWTFTEAGATQYGCHEPGHFAAGMVGDITVTQ
jgi:uncharacterized cupredoxin-like copper-binding protein